MKYLCEILRQTFTVGMDADTLLTLNLTLTIDKIIVSTDSYLSGDTLYIYALYVLKISDLVKISNLKSFNCSNMRSNYKKNLEFFNYKMVKIGNNWMSVHDINPATDEEFLEYEVDFTGGFITDDTLLDLPETLESLECDNTHITGSCFSHFKYLKKLRCKNCESLIFENVLKIAERCDVQYDAPSDDGNSVD